MKRIICWIIALMLPAACASADRYLEASFSFPGLSDHRLETIDLYEQDYQITAVSTLLPDYAVISDQAMYSALSVFHSVCSMSPGTTRESVQKTDKQVRDMIEQYLSDPVTGVYSGELFENALSVRTARIQLSDFFSYITNTLDSSEEPFIVVCKAVLSSIMNPLLQTEEGQQLFIEINVFDNWQYMSAILFNREQAVMTVSSDLSQVNVKRTLICYSENGRNYFRDILINDDKDTITVTASLRSGTGSTYQRIMTEKPLTAAQLTVTKERFDLEMYGNGLSKPLTAAGTTSAQENGEAQLNAAVFVKDHDDQAINLCINLSQMARPVSFSDKEIISLSEIKENAGFTIAAASKATELAAEIMPTLPDEYQKLLFKLLYP